MRLRVPMVLLLAASLGPAGASRANHCCGHIDGALCATVWINPTATVFLAAADVGVGLTFTVTAEVMNCGGGSIPAGDLKDVAPTDVPVAGCPIPSDIVVLPLGGAVTLLSGPAPSCTALLPENAHAFFTWLFRADAKGVVEFTVSFSGRQAVGPPIGAGGAGRADTATVTLRDAELRVDVTNPVRATVGQAHLPVVARVTNVGLATATQVFPAWNAVAGCGAVPELGVAAPAGGSVTFESALPAPACAQTLAPGAYADFTWLFTASRSGEVDFSATCAGLDSLGATVRGMDFAFALRALVVQAPPRLVATLTVVPAGTITFGSQVAVYLDLVNTGEATADGVAPAAPTLAGAALLTPLPCPPVGSPCPVDAANAPAASIAGGGGAARFTWAYRADGAGNATFSAGAAGVDRNTGLATSAAPVAAPLLVGPPALLSLTVTGARDLVPGQTFTLTVAVINPGATPIVQSGFAATLNGSSAWLTVVSASPPVPRRYEPCPACAPGGAEGCCRLEYVLTLRLSPDAPLGAGTLAVTASGADVAGLVVVSAGAPVAVRVFPGVSKVAGVSENPFHPARGAADLTFVVAPVQGDGPVSLRVYSLGGELVRTLVDETRAAGVWHAAWDGRNDGGERVASGIFLVLFQARGVRDVVRLAVIR